jgi:hypothetical protein
MDHACHRPELVQRVEEDHRMGRIGKCNRDSVAAGDALGGQRAGASIHRLEELAVGACCAEEVVGDGTRLMLCDLPQRLVHGLPIVVQVLGYLAVVLEPGFALVHL